MTKKQALTDTLPRFIQLLPEEAVELLDFNDITYHDNQVLGLMFVRDIMNWVSVEIGDTRLNAVIKKHGDVRTLFDSTDLSGFHTVVAHDELLKALKAL